MLGTENHAGKEVIEMGDGAEGISLEGPVCPLPIANHEKIIMGHGAGGRMTQQLIDRVFYPAFDNPALMQCNDSAVVSSSQGGRWAVTTDSHVVSPHFFGGGDIGRLAVCGTVNDLAMVGARPLWLTAGFILEEGFPIESLDRIVISMRRAAEESGVLIVAGDTKVAERGAADGVFITTSGVGWVPEGRDVSGSNARAGDRVLLSGPIGEHGIAVLAARGEFEFEAQIASDVAPLNGLVEAMFEAADGIRAMRDPTRGGVATALNEIAVQSDRGIELLESAIPVSQGVLAACELLGFDPLYLANEGRLLAIVREQDAEAVLEAMRSHPYGAEACIIGRVLEAPAGRVLMQTEIGGRRVIDRLSGDMLPRIC